MSPDTDALNADAFIVNVAVWAEAELVDVEVFSLTDDLLELGGKIANYRIIVGRGVVTLYGCRMIRAPETAGKHSANQRSRRLPAVPGETLKIRCPGSEAGEFLCEKITSTG